MQARQKRRRAGGSDPAVLVTRRRPSRRSATPGRAEAPRSSQVATPFMSEAAKPSMGDIPTPAVQRSRRAARRSPASPCSSAPGSSAARRRSRLPYPPSRSSRRSSEPWSTTRRTCAGEDRRGSAAPSRRRRGAAVDGGDRARPRRPQLGGPDRRRWIGWATCARRRGGVSRREHARVLGGRARAPWLRACATIERTLQRRKMRARAVLPRVQLLLGVDGGAVGSRDVARRAPGASIPRHHREQIDFGHCAPRQVSSRHGPTSARRCPSDAAAFIATDTPCLLGSGASAAAAVSRLRPARRPRSLADGAVQPAPRLALERLRLRRASCFRRGRRRVTVGSAERALTSRSSRAMKFTSATRGRSRWLQLVAVCAPRRRRGRRAAAGARRARRRRAIGPRWRHDRRPRRCARAHAGVLPKARSAVHTHGATSARARTVMARRTRGPRSRPTKARVAERAEPSRAPSPAAASVGVVHAAVAGRELLKPVVAPSAAAIDRRSGDARRHTSSSARPPRPCASCAMVGEAGDGRS